MYENKIDLPPGARAIIRSGAWRLYRCLGGGAEDVQDYEQELMLQLWLSAHKFDPKKAHFNIWVTTVVERTVEKILRKRRARKRSAGAVRSLDAPAADGEPTEGPAQPGTDRDTERADLRADVDEVLPLLPAKLRRIAEGLRGRSVSQLARQLRIPRATLQYQVEQLRRPFEAVGLRKYL